MSIDSQGREYLLVDWLCLNFWGGLHFIFINTSKVFGKEEKLGQTAPYYTSEFQGVDAALH